MSHLPTTFHPEVTNRAFVEEAWEMGAAAAPDAINPFLPDSPVHEAWELGHAPRTAFLSVAVASDGNGFRWSLSLASCLYGAWSDASRREYCTRHGLPTRALTLSPAEYARLESQPAGRFGYMATAGDLESPMIPAPWISHPSLSIPGYPDAICRDLAACRAFAAGLPPVTVS